MIRWLPAIGIMLVFLGEVQPRVAAQEEGAEPAIVSAYAAALNAHDADALVALYADDAIVDQAIQNGLVLRGREAIRGWIAVNLTAVPDLRITTEQVIAQGDQIAWAWNFIGTYTGQFPGYPAGTGQPIALRLVSLLELRDGQIARQTLYYDNDAFLSQTGGARPERSAAATGSVLVRVFVCPAGLADSTDASALAAACTPAADTDLRPTLHALDDEVPLPGLVDGDGVYRWDDLPFGDYAVSGSATMTGFSSLRVTDAAGNPVQNPALRLSASSPAAQLDFYLFQSETADS